MNTAIDPNELRIWAIQIARSRFTWLPARERHSILSRVIAEMLERANLAEGRQASVGITISADVIPMPIAGVPCGVHNFPRKQDGAA